MSHRISKVQRSTIPRNRRLRKRNYKKVPKHFIANANMVTYISRNIMPYPPRYRTKMACAIYGSIAAGSNTGQYFAGLNSIITPFNGGGWPGALPAIATLQPTGFSAICNANLYRSFRVFSSKIEIEFLPQALTDTVECTVSPSTTGATPTNTSTAMTQPYTRSGFMSSSKNNSNYRNKSAIINSISLHKFVGVRKNAIEDDLSGQYFGTYNTSPGEAIFWVVNWACPDVANLATALEYRVKILYFVEFFNSVNASMTEV